MTLRYKIRIIFSLIFLGFLVFLVWQKINPLGNFSYTYNFSEDSKLVSNFSPKTRIKDRSKIIKEPVYLSLFAPRRFDKVQLNLSYINKSDSDFKTGFLMDKDLWRYNLKPIENKKLESLNNTWNSTSVNNDFLFLQKKEKFSSLKEFLDGKIDRDNLALYNYDLNKDFSLDKYTKNNKLQEKSLFIRGAHEFFVYLGDKEDLYTKMEFLDLNQNKDADDLGIAIYHQDKKIYSKTIQDNRGQENTNKKENFSLDSIELSNLKSGVYKINLQANNDIVLKNLITPHEKIVFNNKLWLYKHNRNQIDLYTNGNYLQLKTTHPSSLDEFKINQDKFSLNETYNQKKIDLNKFKNLKHIKFVKDGLIVSSNGVFSFAKSEFFNPTFKELSSSLDLDKIDYILAKYSPAKEISGDLKRKTLNFDISSAYRENNKYRLLFSLPSLKSTKSEYIKIKKIEVKFKGKNLWQLIQKQI